MSLFKKHFAFDFEYIFALQIGEIYETTRKVVWKIIGYDIAWNFDNPNGGSPEYEVELVSIGVDPFTKSRREPGYRTRQSAVHVDLMIHDGYYTKLDLTYEIET